MTDSKLETNNEKKSVSGIGRLLAWVLVLALLVVVAIQLIESQKGVVGRGEMVPEFSLTIFDGSEITQEDMEGKLVVVNFWASWCKPCEQEAAELQMAWELYENRGDVLFLGVDYVDTEKEALAYLERFSITYPNGPDLGTRISQAFRLRGVPETYFINKRGEVVFVQIGPFTSLDQITTLVESFLEP